MSQSTSIFELLSVSFLAILPTFAWILVGIVARRIVPASERLVQRGDRFVFYVGMPTVLFFGASKVSFEAIRNSGYLVAGTLSILMMVAGSYLYSRWRGFSLPHSGLMAQTAYRANLAIIGIALCASAFGDEGVVVSAMSIAVWTLLFNVLGAIVLDLTHASDTSLWSVVKSILKNPLIIGIASGLTVGLLTLKLPETAYQFARVFQAFIIPFALVCLGASISFRSFGESRAELFEATLARLVVAPLLAVILCLIFGVSGVQLGVTFLLLGGPAAMACYVMVAAVGGNVRLAANMVVLTTLLAPLTLSCGLFVLSWLQLI